MCIGLPRHPGPTKPASPKFNKVPKISGQSGKYIAASLNAYKKGERKHP